MIKHYFHRRKEASRIHHLLYDIQQAKINCSDGLFKGLNEVKCNKLANAVEDIKNQLEESFYGFTPLEKKLVLDCGFIDPDIRHDPFEWLRRFERLLRRELQGKMFMFCWQRFCITLWEVPLWIGGIAVILFIS